MPLIIDINQKKISIGDKYSIAINGQPYYKAKASLWRLFPKVELITLNGDQVLMSIEQGFGFITPNIMFTIGNMHYKLETLSWWNRRFAVRVGNDFLEIVGHRGRKVSILQNGRQIAWFTKDAVTFMSGDNYKCIANNNAPGEWLIAAMLFWDMHYNRGNKKMINIQLGSIMQSQPFDTTWQPL